MRLRGSFGFCSRGISSNVRESNIGFRSPSTLAQPYLNLPNPTFLSVLIINPNMEFIGTRQKSRFWWVKVVYLDA